MSKLLNTSPVVRTARENRGWSRATLARKSGVSEATICRLELQGHTPKLSTLVPILEALDLSMSALLGETTETTS